MPPSQHRDLSVVVVAYNMRREAQRTLRSLSRAYQCGIDDLAYEVIVVDNGSAEPLDATAVSALGPEFRLVLVPEPGGSPLAAANRGVAESTGDVVAVILDGACLVTPGTLRGALRALEAYPGALATTYAWQLGDDRQARATQDAYDQAAEDRLLGEVGWPEDGYAVFTRAVLDPSNPDGWFGPISESRFLATPRPVWERLGGYDEAFRALGGGLGGIDLLRRVADLGDVATVGLLGEGSFHQVHGGVTTNSPVDRWPEYHAEYVGIRGRDWEMPPPPARWIGEIGGAARTWLDADKITAELQREARAASIGISVLGGRVIDAGSGFHADGWVETSASCRIEATGPTTGAEIVGSLLTELRDAVRVTVRLGDAVHEAVITPGRFVLDVPVVVAAGDTVELACETGSAVPGELLGPVEQRPLSWVLEHVRLHDAGDDPRDAFELSGGRVVEALGGFYDDSWVATLAGCTIEATRDASALRIDGWYPEWDGMPGRLTVTVGDAEPRVLEVGPGAFAAEVGVAVSAGERVRLQVASAAASLPDEHAGDTRPVAWRLHGMVLHAGRDPV
jgi:hypothetical protein